MFVQLSFPLRGKVGMGVGLSHFLDVRNVIE